MCCIPIKSGCHSVFEYFPWLNLSHKNELRFIYTWLYCTSILQRYKDEAVNFLLKVTVINKQLSACSLLEGSHRSKTLLIDNRREALCYQIITCSTAWVVDACPSSTKFLFFSKLMCGENSWKGSNRERGPSTTCMYEISPTHNSTPRRWT